MSVYIKHLLGKVLRFSGLFWYRLFLPLKVKKMRAKKRIKVLFVIEELGPWKTETLFKEMFVHERFAPVLLVVDSNDDKGGRMRLESYLQSSGINYMTDKEISNIQKQISPDIIFYQKAHGGSIDDKYFFHRNKKSLFCYVNYAFHTVLADWGCNQPLQNYVWQLYYENESAKIGLSYYMDNKARNIIVTGLPFMDDMSSDVNISTNPWKPQSIRKKRIIWAPHYTINPQKNKWLLYGTFLNYYEEMLKIANEYKDEIQIAFKPHPKLKYSLFEIWGEERTNAYYKQWESLENAQLELGNYKDLFLTSDALIHDCSSFTIEYLYTLKPVMYLSDNPELHKKDLTIFATEAFNLHEIGKNSNDIRKFINDVINDIDPKSHLRKRFYDKELIPPHQKDSCTNIINAILGQSDYKNS